METGPPPPTTRVLQILYDTAASDHNLSALGLHDALTANETSGVGRGLEMRTIALASGRSTELGSTVPVMAPVARSIAAVAQFRREQRWADVVLVRGARAAGVVSRARGSTPWVTSLWDEPQAWADHPSTARRFMRLVHRGASVTVNTTSAERTLRGLLDGDGNLSGGPGAISLIPDAVDLGVGLTTAASAHVAAARAAARRELGISPGTLAATVVTLRGDQNRRDTHVQVSEEVEKILHDVAALLPDVVALSTKTADPELVTFAADVVVVNGGGGGPSGALMGQICHGALAIAPDWPTLDDLLIDSVTAIRVPSRKIDREGLTQALTTAGSDQHTRREMVDHCVERIKAEHDPREIGARWFDCLTAALPSHP